MSRFYTRFEMILNKMSKNSKQKIVAYISILCVHIKSFREKPTFFFVSRAIKQTLVIKKLFTRYFFIFFTQDTKKCWFYAKFGVHTYNIDICANFIFRLFVYFKIFLSGSRMICSRSSKINFRSYIV
jgi:hypothetical protein